MGRIWHCCWSRNCTKGIDLESGLKSETDAAPAEAVASLPGRSSGGLLRSVFREETFFLILSVFITQQSG